MGTAKHAEAKPAPTAAKDRVVRVFISSTFPDMFEEREILVKRIFPQPCGLRSARRYSFGPIS